MKHVFIINPTAGKTDSRQKIYTWQRPCGQSMIWMCSAS